MRSTSFALLVVGTLVASGCAHSHSGPSGLELCREWLRVRVCMGGECCTTPSLHHPIDRAECEAEVDRSLDTLCADWDVSEDDPRIAWNGALAGDLLDELERSAATCTPPTFAVHDVLALVTEPRVPLGGACAGPLSGVACIGDAFCNSEGRCEALPLAGARCSSSGCAPGLYCSSRGAACAAPQPLDAPCRVEDLTEGCVTGLYCDPASATCRPRRAPGESCEPVDRFDPCVPDAECAATTTHTCLPRAIAGEPCDHDRDCVPDLRCIEGSCTAISDRDRIDCNGF